MPQTDHILIQKAQKNPAEYETIYKKYSKNVYTYFWHKIGRNKENAEDLMQETFLKSFANLQKYKERGYSYLTYLLSVAHNLLVDYYRKPALLSLDDFTQEDVAVEIVSDVEKKLDAEMLWKAIRVLPLRNRSVLFMKYQKEMRISDIAKVTHNSEDAIKSLLSRIRKKLAHHPYLQP